MVNIKRKILLYLLFSLFSIFVLNPMIAKAADFRVFDDGSLFTDDEITRLNEEANNLSYNYDMDIIIVTTDDAKGKTAREYADDYFDYNGFGRGDNRDGILFLIDMDNREAYISTSGMGIKYLTDYRIERIIELVLYELKDEYYYGAAGAFLTSVGEYLESGIPSNQYEEKAKNSLTFFEIIISFLVAAIGSAGFYFGITKKYNMKNINKPLNFRNNSIVNMAKSEEKLIDTFVTRRNIPKSNNSDSGKSSTHTSSSGRTHGGGGGKF